MAYDSTPQDAIWREYRVAQGILMEEGRVLLSANRWFSDQPPVWTLPGGRAVNGEGIEEALIREFREETGLSVQPNNLAFVAEARSTRNRRLFHTCAFTVSSPVWRSQLRQRFYSRGIALVPIADLHLYITAPSLYDALHWHLNNMEAPARYWFFPEYETQP